jgi:hypothetical protein
MTKPIIVAVDPSHDDVTSASLGVLVARLREAPLVLAAAHPVDDAAAALESTDAR